MSLVISLRVNSDLIFSAEVVRVETGPDGVNTYQVNAWAEGTIDDEPARGKWSFRLKHVYGEGALVLSKKVHDALFKIENMYETAGAPVDWAREMTSSKSARTEVKFGQLP